MISTILYLSILVKLAYGILSKSLILSMAPLETRRQARLQRIWSQFESQSGEQPDAIETEFIPMAK
jgi:uncharacterized protein YcsI (UPF0317 family)